MLRARRGLELGRLKIKPTGPALPRPTRPFAGSLGRLLPDSEPSAPDASFPAADAPNIVLVLLDDVGFGTCSTFGGRVPTPALDRVARSVPVVFSISGFYPHIHRFTGEIHLVTLERLSEPSPQVKAMIEGAEFRASLAVQ